MVEGEKMKQRKSLLTEPLGLFGWKTLEPVILAALATELPMLLVGKHGSAKSFLLERLAESLNLNFRSYNASLINYDDLVGIPIPANNNTTLEYISNPNSIWDAEVVFIDEINRTKPELQNKLFPIIYDKRVQGQKLEKLKYRWAAMNPSFSDEDEDIAYFGAMPLDPALADRFPFIIEVPEWDDLSKKDKKNVLFDADKGRHDFPVDIKELVDKVKAKIEEISSSKQGEMANYILILMDVLKSSLGYLSTRRATMFQETLIAIYASMLVLSEYTKEEVSFVNSIYLHIQTTLPLTVNMHINKGLLLTIAGKALQTTKVGKSFESELLLITDPAKQIRFAIKNRNAIKNSTLSEVITNAISQIPHPERRVYALISFLIFKENKDIYATTIETLAIEVRPVFETKKTETNYYSQAAREMDRFKSYLDSFSEENYYKYLKNLAFSFDLDIIHKNRMNAIALVNLFIEMWEVFIVGKN